jgi:hypothetical protein
MVEFEKTVYQVQESDKFISLPIVRTGDLTTDIQVECLTREETATNNFDFVSKSSKSENHLVKIPAGEAYGFCDIEIIDDEIHEMQSESFKAFLKSPTAGVQVGSRNEAQISIVGPNDGLYFCTKHYF